MNIPRVAKAAVAVRGRINRGAWSVPADFIMAEGCRGNAPRPTDYGRKGDLLPWAGFSGGLVELSSPGPAPHIGRPSLPSGHILAIAARCNGSTAWPLCARLNRSREQSGGIVLVASSGRRNKRSGCSATAYSVGLEKASNKQRCSGVAAVAPKSRL